MGERALPDSTVNLKRKTNKSRFCCTQFTCLIYISIAICQV